jgi:hypothetical protein
MKRSEAMKYIGPVLDDALAVRTHADIPANACLIGWQCGFEPLFVAVFSYMGFTLDEDEAIEIAVDYLLEKKWFADPSNTEPDYVIQGE